MTLSRSISDSLESSEESLFRTFVTNIISLQKQLYVQFRTYRVFRERLLTAVNLPEIQVALRDIIPCTSRTSGQQDLNQLSGNKNMAGSTSACLSHIEEEGSGAPHLLGKMFGGDASGTSNPPWKTFITERSRTQGGRGGGLPLSKQLSPEWMRGVKRCFVSCLDHMPNDLHAREEVTAAITKLK